MSTLASNTRFTPDDLLRMPDAVNYELVDGRLVERQMGMESSGVGARIIARLVAFCDSQKAGHVFGSDASYQCYPDAPDKVRRPDVSYVGSGRFPNNTVPQGHSRIPPDLAIEVVSPNDLAYDVAEKVREYLAAGVRLVWVIDPHSRIVQVHRPAGAAAGRLSGLESGDTISGEDVLSGFSCPVAEFFKPV